RDYCVWNGNHTTPSVFPYTPLFSFKKHSTGNRTQPTDIVDRNPNFKGPAILGTPEHWFDARAFSMPTAGTFGNVGRSSLRGPSLFNVDSSLFKRIPIRESVTLQFRAVVVNVLKRANFALPNFIVFQGNSNSNSYSESAGQITNTATTSRQIQFALKLMF